MKRKRGPNRWKTVGWLRRKCLLCYLIVDWEVGRWHEAKKRHERLCRKVIGP